MAVLIFLYGGCSERMGVRKAEKHAREEVFVGSQVDVRWARVYNGNYTTNEHLDVDLRFTDHITVKGMPRITLHIGEKTTYAHYAFGSGTKLLTFRYTIKSNDRDSDGIVIGESIDRGKGSLTSKSGIKIVTSFRPPGNLGFVKVNTAMPFVSRWRTTKPNESITLPLQRGHTYNFTVDWGDGSSVSQINSYTHASKTHIYASKGDYIVTIAGTFPTWSLEQSKDKNKIVEVVDLGEVGWVSLRGAFLGCANLTSVSGGNLSLVTNMSYAFTSATALRTVNAQGWDVGKVANMAFMFHDAIVASPDVGRWDVANVKDMSYMFSYAIAANPDVRDWQVGNVQSMVSMFMNTRVANPDVAFWDVSSVRYMKSMFAYGSNLMPDVGRWDMANVIDMTSMFYKNKAANPDFTEGDFSHVEDMSFMFTGATSFDHTNYSNLLTALERTSSKGGVRLDVAPGLGASLSDEAQMAKEKLVNNRGWKIND